MLVGAVSVVIAVVWVLAARQDHASLLDRSTIGGFALGVVGVLLTIWGMLKPPPASPPRRQVTATACKGGFAAAAGGSINASTSLSPGSATSPAHDADVHARARGPHSRASAAGHDIYNPTPHSSTGGGASEARTGGGGGG